MQIACVNVFSECQLACKNGGEPVRWVGNLLVGVCLLWAGRGEAQNHPELDWRVFETEHFRVLYHQGLEHAASRAAEIAEEAYGPITQLYGYEPAERVRIVLKDYDDYANGAAFFYHDTIEIWTTSLDHDYEPVSYTHLRAHET